MLLEADPHLAHPTVGTCLAVLSSYLWAKKRQVCQEGEGSRGKASQVLKMDRKLHSAAPSKCFPFHFSIVGAGKELCRILKDFSLITAFKASMMSTSRGNGFVTHTSADKQLPPCTKPYPGKRRHWHTDQGAPIPLSFSESFSLEPESFAVKIGTRITSALFAILNN